MKNIDHFGKFISTNYNKEDFIKIRPQLEAMGTTIIHCGAPGTGTRTKLCNNFLAIGSCISALTKSQVISFVISVVICFMFILSGFPMVLDLFESWAPQAVIDAIASFSFLTHFTSIKKGVIDMRDVIYFSALITFWLYVNVVIVENKKAD